MINPHQHLKRFYITLFVLTIVLGIANVIYLCFRPETTLNAVLFCGLQYVAMLLILAAPIVLRKRFLLNVPLILSVAIAAFAFTAMVLGDGLNFYGRYRGGTRCCIYCRAAFFRSLVCGWCISFCPIPIR